LQLCRYDLGLIGGAILVIQEEFGTSSFQNACIVGAAKVGAFFGVFLGGAYMYRHGRKVAILVDSLFFVVGPLVMATTASVGTLILGRLLVGMGIGLSAVVVPAYLGEVAPAHMRGSVVTVYELMLCVGMVVSSLADAALQVCSLRLWRSNSNALGHAESPI
jgi:MFS family permease